MKENIKILVVDDQADDRELFSKKLRDLGYSQIKEAVNGFKAIDLARDYQPDLILMDTNMPGISGCETCRRIRQEEYGKKLAIIGMSDGRHREGWMEVGADDFLSKTTISRKKDELDEIIQKALEKYV